MRIVVRKLKKGTSAKKYEAARDSFLEKLRSSEGLQVSNK